MTNLWILRFVALRTGIACEAVFKTAGAAQEAYNRAREAALAVEVADDFGVVHLIDTRDFFVAYFSLADIAARNQATGQFNQRAGDQASFLPTANMRQ